MEENKSYLRPEGRGIKLHLGCGDYWFDGFLNIDFGTYGGTDMLFDIRQPLPFQDGVVEVIEVHDVVEHMADIEIEPMLKDWYRVLIKDGRVTASLPDFDGLATRYVNSQGEERKEVLLNIYGFYGDHKAGYTKESIKELFEKHGFKDITVESIETKKDNCPRLEIVAWKR